MNFYISFVTHSRNDDYSGGLPLLEYGIRYLIDQCNRYQLPAEIVIVDWNPPQDRPTLFEVFQKLGLDRGRVSLKIVTVPGFYHTQYRYHTLSPLHCGMAANVGIRRANGQFILVRSPDVFYPDALIQFLAQKNLKEKTLYRVCRADVRSDLRAQFHQPFPVFQDLCQQNVVLENGPLKQPEMPFKLPDLFTNAGGDFQLLDRESWLRLKGYPETKDILSIEVDGLLAYTAYGQGIQEQVLDCFRIYKISHARSHSSRVVNRKDLWARFWLKIEAGIHSILPFRLFRGFYFWLRILLNYPANFYRGIRKRCYERSLVRFKFLSLWRGPLFWKNNDWGLAQEDLPEGLI